VERIAVPTRAVLIALLTVVGLDASPAAASAGRAVVSGTYIVAPTGRLHVSLASDAARVKLTYRTAARRARSRIVRIRDGKGTASLARGSRHLKARALATSQLRSSGRVRVLRNPVLRDVDGNGIREYFYDLDTNGGYETVLFDNNRNGRFEAVFLLDTGAASGLFKDQNEDGYFELVSLDADRDGRPERLFYDGDGDGYPELQCLDYIGPDGLADTWVDTRVASGDAQQDRAANDLMVQNIVHLNQLRQLDPWSTAYIPYDPSPSLLR
jgi:hypothetical protein